MMERIYFGQINLISHPSCNLSFRVKSDCVLDKLQRYLVDILSIAHSKRDTSHFVAAANALCQYFSDKNRENRFKYYVVMHGKTNGVF